LCHFADKQVFEKILDNTDHVLYRLIPPFSTVSGGKQDHLLISWCGVPAP